MINIAITAIIHDFKEFISNLKNFPPIFKIPNGMFDLTHNLIQSSPDYF